MKRNILLFILNFCLFLKLLVAVDFKDFLPDSFSISYGLVSGVSSQSFIEECNSVYQELGTEDLMEDLSSVFGWGISLRKGITERIGLRTGVEWSEFSVGELYRVDFLDKDEVRWVGRERVSLKYTFWHYPFTCWYKFMEGDFYNIYSGGGVGMCLGRFKVEVRDGEVNGERLRGGKAEYRKIFGLGHLISGVNFFLWRRLGLRIEVQYWLGEAKVLHLTPSINRVGYVFKEQLVKINGWKVVGGLEVYFSGR